ncbi:ABC transporter ATP-binding protein [Gulosibacter sp. 10]|uniref:ABC transporter ATP-binding protein n=1 Tax=Gulosibacter sp. 10 TaxID=1255570 RepID=UPI00097F67A7|nr:ABC transporter ATP-binding protein [Gulosibacter sp. 10]SJM65209.1 ABC transporter ATP-binding protein [Gulosibacter sp. 10]
MIRTFLDLLPSGSRARLAAHLALTLLSVALRAAGIVLLVPALAALFGPEPAGAWPWIGALAAATVAGWIVDWVVARIGFDLGFGLLEHGQAAVAERIARIRLGWFDVEHAAAARRAVAATGPELVGLIGYLVTPLLSAVLLPIAIGVALLPIAWPLGVAALIGAPLLLGAFWASSALGRRADAEAAATNSDLTERIVEFARVQQALRASRRVEPARSSAGEALARQHGAGMRLLLMQVPGQIVFSLATQLALIVLAGTTVLLTTGGAVSIPEAIALIVVIVRYLDPFLSLGGLAPGLESASRTLRDIGRVLDAEPVREGAERVPAADAPAIELRGVGFHYGDPAQPVLEGLDLRIEAGTTTAIVGPSGSGKSTVLALIAGLHEPTSGRVLVEGVDLAALDAGSRAALITMVFQQPFLFDGTIRENVLVGAPGAREAALEHAARLARVDAVVAGLPRGWETRTGEGGASLSGGERQRVSIARALLKPAPVLLVDEATSALDTENEAAVVAALEEDPRRRTRVIVAHRLESVRRADRVLFLEEGRIVEDGPVEALLRASGRFAEFWRRQDAASGWRIRD